MHRFPSRLFSHAACVVATLPFQQVRAAIDFPEPSFFTNCVFVSVDIQ
jgi:hypothetical protein